jgi:hypothetical protein
MGWCCWGRYSDGGRGWPVPPQHMGAMSLRPPPGAPQPLVPVDPANGIPGMRLQVHSSACHDARALYFFTWIGGPVCGPPTKGPSVLLCVPSLGPTVQAATGGSVM